MDNGILDHINGGVGTPVVPQAIELGRWVFHIDPIYIIPPDPGRGHVFWANSAVLIVGVMQGLGNVFSNVPSLDR